MYSLSTSVRNMLEAEREKRAEYDRWLKINGLVRKGARANGKRATNKSSKRPYRVHLVWDMNKKGKKQTVWVPLGHYPTIQGAYARVNELRAHHLAQRRERADLSTIRTPTFFIEIKPKEKNQMPKIRAFELEINAALGMFEMEKHSAFQVYQTYTYAKHCALMPSDKVKGKH